MTTVFVLNGIIYMGSEVLGVFADEVSAVMALAKFQGVYEDFEIKEWLVESGPNPLGVDAANPFGWAKAG